MNYVINHKNKALKMQSLHALSILENYFLQNSEDVGSAQKAQKQERDVTQ